MPSSPTPVHFFSHGSTMMLGEESASATYWKRCGDQALAHNIKGVIMMGAHWDTPPNTVQVSTNPSPQKSPVSGVHPSKYTSYTLNPDLPTSERILTLLRSANFSASANKTFDWIHDTFLILIRMFPTRCPPTSIISMSSAYDPHYHIKLGSTLRPLREEGYLFIGTGGAVHNLYRNEWRQMVSYGDNFAQIHPPGEWALGFRQALEDAFLNNKGPRLRRALARLMKHPEYRHAHATDDHFMSALFVAGVAGGEEDEMGEGAVLGAEDWELQNMCNSQYTIGTWGDQDQESTSKE